jgi:hypothetical protein
MQRYVWSCLVLMGFLCALSAGCESGGKSTPIPTKGSGAPGAAPGKSNDRGGVAPPEA